MGSIHEPKHLSRLPERLAAIGVIDGAGERNYLSHKALQVFEGNAVCATAYKNIKCEDLLAVPVGKEHCKTFIRGALYSQQGRMMPFSERPPGWVIGALNPEILLRPFSVPQERAPMVKGRSVYLGHWMGHYGHFITESLSRLWLMDGVASFDRIFVYPFIFGGIHNFRIHPFQQYLLSLLGIDSDRIELLRRPMRFQHLSIPEQAWPVNVHVNVKMREVYARIRQAHAQQVGTPPKIFLSRLPSVKYQRLANIPAIEAVFQASGFEVLYPEQMTIVEQLQCYANCQVMAGLSGTLLHNCLFAPDSAHVIEVGDLRTRRSWIPMQLAAVQLSGVGYIRIPYHGDTSGHFDVHLLDEVLAGLPASWMES